MKRRKDCRLWLQLLIVLGTWTCWVKCQQYNMDDPARCNFLNPLDIQRDATVTVNARSSTGGTSGVIACRLTFKSVDTDALISLEVRSFSINSCGIELNIVGDKTTDNYVYRCASRPPTIINLNSQTATIETKITNSAETSDYNFVLVLTPKRTTVNRSTESSQVATGLVIGIVGGILGLIAIVAVVGCCCFRKYRNSRAHMYHEKESKAKLDENDMTNYVGYTNESYKKAPSNGKLDSTPSSHRKLLLAPSDSSEDKSDLSNGNKNMNRALPLPDSSNRSPTTKKGLNFGGKREQNFSERPVDVDRPKNPMLNALKENKKFKETFKSTEDDAEKRARSFSSGSRSSLDKLGPAPSVPDSLEEDTMGQPKLPVVAILPKTQKNPKTAMIRRRPTSTSSEELGRLSKSAEDMDDPDIKVLRDDTPPSPTEVVPIQVKDPNKGKTQHTLRPDRGRSPNVRKKSQGIDVDSLEVGRDRIRSVDRALNERDREEGSDVYSSGRYNKRTKRSKSSSSSKGFGHRRNRSKSVEDPYRPNTPTFSIGSVEDLESLPPLKRSGSKQSLYSSRSSLYDRRGRRGRKNSYTESLASYAHDDIDMFRRSGRHGSTGTTDDFDGYERPLSRFDRMRMSKSAGELTYDMREQATQTLRETATQTGHEHSVIFEPKRQVKKKTKVSKVSSSGTQTATKKGGLKIEKSKTEKESEERADLSAKETAEGKAEKITKSRRNEEAEPSKAEKKKKPITKPKPKPRKSQSAGIVDSLDKDAEEDQSGLGNADSLPPPPSIQQQQENQQPQVLSGIASQPGLMGAPAGLYYGGPLPGVPPPNYPGQPGVPYQTMTQGYPSGIYPQSQMPNQRTLPQTQSYNAPRQPRKSNWDLLCELAGTDGNRSDERETASMASSVFTSNPASVAYTGMYPGQHQPTTAYTHPQFNQMHLPGYQPSQPAFHPVDTRYNQMQHPYNQFQPIQTGETGRGQTPQSLGTNDSSSSAKSSSSGQGRESTESGEKRMQKMSSWEALKEATDKQYRIAYGTPTNDGTKTESIV